MGRLDFPPEFLRVRREKYGGGPVMVSGGVAYNGVAPFHFVTKKVETSAEDYRSRLRNRYGPEFSAMYSGKGSASMEDGAAAHTAKSNREWRDANFPKTLNQPQKWPTRNPALSPCDYSLLGSCRENG